MTVMKLEREAGPDMDMEDIKRVINETLPLRPPTFTAGTAPNVKVAALEDYLLESAFWAAELEEALHWLSLMVEHFKRQIEEMTGYEIALPRKPQDRLSRDDVLQAKRTVNPVIFDAGAEVRSLRETVLRQIERLKFESGVISRAYTLISGG